MDEVSYTRFRARTMGGRDVTMMIHDMQVNRLIGVIDIGMNAEAAAHWNDATGQCVFVEGRQPHALDDLQIWKP